MKKLWNWLNGRKRDIAAYAGVIVTWLISQHIVDQPTGTMIAAVLTIWTAGAIVHAGVKKDL